MHGLVIMARRHGTIRGSPCVRRVNLLACPTVVCKEGTTPIMVAEVFLPHRSLPLAIVNVHFHHKVAAQRPGYRLPYRKVLDLIAKMIDKHKAHLLIGDFNQAAPQIVHELLTRKA